ncbi:hypothetical protein SK854_00265 [Lentzea sp. BCCO 10_0061]|uniref:ANTAR domain-containing protein n=1 Tax=Lentzea sokolovensis TaxID=3095429 RepID=A0ABU4UM06_9PSEU|nr:MULTISPECIES: hypothetical protein [Lentzea]MDX8140527.1 hypothetical protein [Lentzea sp. BCCO 10_0061]
MFDEKVLGGLGRVLAKAECLRDRGCQPILALAQVGQVNPTALEVAAAAHLVDEAFRDSGLADATRSDEGQHASRSDGVGALPQELASSDQAAEFAGQQAFVH